jgi:primosomal protein N' (replication factor Y)
LESLLAQLDEPAGPTLSPGGPRVPVLLPVALDQTYDYFLPAGLEAPPAGAFVLVPFGPQSRIGVVWDTPCGDPGKPVPDNKLKAIAATLVEVPPLPSASLRFAEWVARYTLTPLGMVVRMMMGAPTVFEPQKPRFGVVRNPEAAEPPRMTPARRRALEIAADGLIRAKSALAAQAQCTNGVIDGLVAAGTLIEVAIPERRFPVPEPAFAEVGLSDAQAVAAHAMRTAADGQFSVTLIDGVTGSGKTEVYFEAVARTLEKGRQALIMLPEIALTSQFMDRFKARFGCPPVEWHSALPAPERARSWRAAATGEARVVVGARSALFLPYTELGLIVVDEEHDGSF